MTIFTDWDPKKADANYRKHRVTFEEADEALNDPLARSRPDVLHSDTEDRRIGIGATDRGRVLIIVYTIRGDAAWIISARCAKPAERRSYMKEPDIIRDAALELEPEEEDEDMLPDYSHLDGWELNHYTTVRPVGRVTLDPDVYMVFRTAEAVNNALRELIAEGRYPTRPDAPDSALPKSRRRRK